MKHSFVKAVVNSLNQEYGDFVEETCNGNLPKAVEMTVLSMVVDGRYKKLYGDFETLADAMNELNEKGYWEV